MNQTAISKAIALGTARTVRSLGNSRYQVAGASRSYTVTRRRDDILICDCPAGQNGRDCYHAAGLFLRHQATLPAAPAPLPQRVVCSECGSSARYHRLVETGHLYRANLAA